MPTLNFRLLLALTILEHQVQHQKGDNQQSTQSNLSTGSAPASLSNPNNQNGGDVTPSASQKNSELKYLVGRPIPQQPMFVAAILSALRMQVNLFTFLHPFFPLSEICVYISNCFYDSSAFEGPVEMAPSAVDYTCNMLATLHGAVFSSCCSVSSTTTL